MTKKNNDYYNRLMREMVDSTIYKSNKCIYATANIFDQYQTGQEQDSESTYNRVVSICESDDILTQANLPEEWKSQTQQQGAQG